MTQRRCVWAVFAAAALGAMPGTGAAGARTPYDGVWSVLITTDAGECDPAARYGLHIEDGSIHYDDPNLEISGQVDTHGQINVTVKSGQQKAVGYGHLSGNYGDGLWSGELSTAKCSGHWEAERRS